MKTEKINMEKENEEHYIYLANRGYKYCVIQKEYKISDDGEYVPSITFGGLNEKEMVEMYIDMGYPVILIKKYKNKIGGNVK